MGTAKLDFEVPSRLQRDFVFQTAGILPDPYRDSSMDSICRAESWLNTDTLIYSQHVAR